MIKRDENGNLLIRESWIADGEEWKRVEFEEIQRGDLFMLKDTSFEKSFLYAYADSDPAPCTPHGNAEIQTTVFLWLDSMVSPRLARLDLEKGKISP